MLEYRYRAYAERVIDGDTYLLRVDLGFHVAISIMVRLYNVDAAKLGTPEGDEARIFVSSLLQPQNLRWDERTAPPVELRIQSYRSKRSFARWVCTVWVPGDEPGEWHDLSELLIAAGHAKAVT